MIFERVDPSFEYQALRLLSEREVWEIGLNPYHAGTRLRMGLCGRPPSVLDFCLGYETRIYYPILMAVLQRLKALPEIDALFPWAGTRPDLNIHLEPLLLPFS